MRASVSCGSYRRLLELERAVGAMARRTAVRPLLDVRCEQHAGIERSVRPHAAGTVGVTLRERWCGEQQCSSLAAGWLGKSARCIQNNLDGGSCV